MDTYKYYANIQNLYDHNFFTLSHESRHIPKLKYLAQELNP
jgi:hypothetical protein